MYVCQSLMHNTLLVVSVLKQLCDWLLAGVVCPVLLTAWHAGKQFADTKC